MEATQLDTLIEIDADGRVHADPEILSRLTNQTFRVSINGSRITLSPLARRLSEIEDADERQRAFEEFVAAVAVAHAPSWPADYNFRDDLYD